MGKNYQKRFILDIWGEGPDLISLQETVNRLGLDACIRFYPWTNSILSLFFSYDLFLFPSRYEGLPFTFLEALASGIPIIASDIAVHQWISCEGQYALLFQNNNVLSLMLTLKEWINNPFKTINKNNNNKISLKWMNKYFNKNKNITKTIKIWEKIIYA